MSACICIHTYIYLCTTTNCCIYCIEENFRRCYLAPEPSAEILLIFAFKYQESTSTNSFACEITSTWEFSFSRIPSFACTHFYSLKFKVSYTIGFLVKKCFYLYAVELVSSNQLNVSIFHVELESQAYCPPRKADFST